MRRQAPFLLQFLMVTASIALAVGLLDRVPARLLGVPHGAVAYRSIETAEQVLGIRLWLPPYYPAELAWPPSRIYTVVGPPLTAVIEIAPKAHAGYELVIWQSPNSRVAPPSRVFPAGQVLTTTEVAVGRHSGQLVHRFLAGGHEVHDLSWNQAGRQVTLRYAGPVNQLILMADSLERVRR